HQDRVRRGLCVFGVGGLVLTPCARATSAGVGDCLRHPTRQRSLARLKSTLSFLYLDSTMSKTAKPVAKPVKPAKAPKAAPAAQPVAAPAAADKAQKIKKVVLAYSGGLDTSIILKWLQDE